MPTTADRRVQTVEERARGVQSTLHNHTAVQRIALHREPTSSMELLRVEQGGRGLQRVAEGCRGLQRGAEGCRDVHGVGKVEPPGAGCQGTQRLIQHCCRCYRTMDGNAKVCAGMRSK